MFRMEYGGHAESCVWEGHIWLPPWLDPYDWEASMQKMMAGPQKEREDE